MGNTLAKIVGISALVLATTATAGCTTTNSQDISTGRKSFRDISYETDTREIAGKLYHSLDIPKGKTAEIVGKPYDRNSLPDSMLVPLDNEIHEITRGSLTTRINISAIKNPYFLLPIVNEGDEDKRLVEKPETNTIELKLPKEFRTINDYTGKISLKIPYDFKQVEFNGREFTEIFSNKPIIGIEDTMRLPVIYLEKPEKPKTQINTQSKERTDLITAEAMFVPVQGKLVPIPEPIKEPEPIRAEEK